MQGSWQHQSSELRVLSPGPRGPLQPLTAPTTGLWAALGQMGKLRSSVKQLLRPHSGKRVEPRDPVVTQPVFCSDSRGFLEREM